MRRTLRVLSTSIVLAALAVIVPSPARAENWTLPDTNKGWGSTTGTLFDNVAFTTAGNHWSAVVMQSWDADYDMAAYRVPGAGEPPARVLASSLLPNDLDVIAVNSTVQAPGPYTLRVKRFSGTDDGFFHMFFRQRGLSLPPAGTNSPIVTLDDQWVMIRDVHLQKGECLAVRAFDFGYSTGAMTLMDGDPAHKAVWSRAEAVATVAYSPADNGTARTLRYTAPVDGDYGFMIVNTPSYPNVGPTLRYQRSTCLLT